MAPGLLHLGEVPVPLAVVPVLVNPLLAILPYVAVAVLSVLASLLRPRAMKHGLRLLWRLKVQVAIVLACGTAAVWAAVALWPDAGPNAGQAEGGGDWPMVRGGPARRGAAPDAPGPACGGVNWVWDGGGAAFYASPAVVGNRVYVTSAAPGVFGGSGAILCLDADTGALVWQADPGGYRATFSSPVVSGSYLVCGEGLHDARDARVVCLDLRPATAGRVLWTYRTASHVECAPVIAGDRVYVGAGDDGYYCFALEPGPEGQAQVLWHVPGREYPDAETSLAVHDGRVYAGLGLGGKAICVLDARTGEELKRIATPYPVFSPPAVADGKLYVGMGNGDYINQAEEVRAKTVEALRADGLSDEAIRSARELLGPAGEVWCIDLESLEVDWRFKAGRTVLGAVAVAGDRLYFGSRDGYLYCLRRDGGLAGKWNAHAPIVTSPAVADGRVYVVSGAGVLYALDRATLEPVWEIVVGAKPPFISSPSVGRGHVYVGSGGDGFLCLGEPGGEGAPPLWPGRPGGPGAAGCLDGTPLPERGALQWQYPADQTGETENAVVTAPVAVVGDDVFVPLAMKPWQGVACLRVGRGTREEAELRWRCDAANGVHHSPAVSGDRLFFVDGRPGDPRRQLHAVAVGTGNVIWRAPVADDASGVLAATGDAVFVQDAGDALACYGLDGERRWSWPVGRLDRAVCATESMLVAATVAPPAIVAMDRPTGRTLWRAALDAAPTTSPAVAGAAVYLGTDRGLEARSLVDGRPLSGWETAGGAVSSDFALARDRAAYVSRAGELIVVRRDTGALVRRIPGATPGLAPLLGRGAVLYFVKDSLRRVPIDDPEAEPTVWTDTSWLGRPTGQMVLAGSRVYVGMAGWGMVCLGAGR